MAPSTESPEPFGTFVDDVVQHVVVDMNSAVQTLGKMEEEIREVHLRQAKELARLDRMCKLLDSAVEAAHQESAEQGAEVQALREEAMHKYVRFVSASRTLGSSTVLTKDMLVTYEYKMLGSLAKTTETDVTAASGSKRRRAGEGDDGNDDEETHAHKRARQGHDEQVSVEPDADERIEWHFRFQQGYSTSYADEVLNLPPGQKCHSVHTKLDSRIGRSADKGERRWIIAFPGPDQPDKAMFYVLRCGFLKPNSGNVCGWQCSRDGTYAHVQLKRHLEEKHGEDGQDGKKMEMGDMLDQHGILVTDKNHVPIDMAWIEKNWPNDWAQILENQEFDEYWGFEADDEDEEGDAGGGEEGKEGSQAQDSGPLAEGDGAEGEKSSD
ncbi:hypothetical protein P8C59_000834 [Phyllachora maydis]|uniref:Uncharacterized protein n=1 Tax=Phyllachora maydis TaxID=1825666 RepID=A0AAD9MAS3_9PEZI|nr:hypothetical protein P8C59_000834 [Phyllachora maydis]